MIDHPHHVHDLVAAYLLDAVTPREAALVLDHLSGCASCRALAEELAEVTAMLPDLASEMDPPPALRQRLMDIVENDLGGAAAPLVPPEPDVPAIVSARRAGRPVFALPLAAAAALALLLIGLGVWRQSQPSAPRPAVYALQGTAAQPSIAGSLTYVAAGERMDLALHGLRLLPQGQVYEVWMIRGKFAVVRGVGAFRPASDGSGHLSLSGEPVPTYTLVGLTVEQAPRSEVPHLPIVATGTIGG